MDDERQESSPLDEGSEMIAHSAQAAYAVSAAVKAGGTAAGAAAGTAMAGPLGTLVGALAGSDCRCTAVRGSTFTRGDANCLRSKAPAGNERQYGDHEV